MRTAETIAGAAETLFPIENLPYGVYSRPALGKPPSVGVAVGEGVLDAAAAARLAGLADSTVEALAQPSLNAFMALGRPCWEETRQGIKALLAEAAADDASRAAAALEPILHPLFEVELHLPLEVADYVDFYASEHHATNVGRIFRPDGEALPAHWKRLPIGYHGRAGTVVVSGTPIRRPRGLRPEPGAAGPTFGPSRKLDVEVEVAYVVGVRSTLGEAVATSDFEDHVFGVCLLNDWSARDIQAYEYVPLGPFLGKSFATSISAWVTPLAALGAARCDPPPQDPPVASYLEATGGGAGWALDLGLELELNGTVVSRPPFAGMYWTGPQQLAHMTVNGASLRTGDLFASGTVSGPERSERGSFLELSWNGTEPLRLPGGGERSFLADGDEAVVRATAPGAGGRRIGLGEVRGRVVAAEDR